MSNLVFVIFRLYDEYPVSMCSSLARAEQRIHELVAEDLAEFVECGNPAEDFVPAHYYIDEWPLHS